MNVIEIKGLTKYYGKARGIDDLSLSVHRGDFFGFIGPNGAGKSTTIRSILGLIKPTAGSAELLGMDIHSHRQQILERVGYLPSESIFYTGMRVRELLKLSADLRRRNCDAQAKELCQRLELDMSKRVEELSFGNRKKVGIVCALQHCPELLILDEPTSGLDPLMQRTFYEIMQERNQEGATIFLSSHILSEVQRNCNRAAIIRGGKIIACDSVSALSSGNAKRVTIQGSVDLRGLAVKDLRTTETGVSFLYGGQLSMLLERLSAGMVSDLTIAEPDLEEIFMHYYEREGAGHDTGEA